MHGEVGPNLRHPAYLYCLGEDTRRPLTVLSPTADMSPTALPLPSSTTRGPSAGRGHVRHDSGIDAEKLRKSLEQASPSSASGSATMSGTTASSTVSPASVGAAFPAKTGPAATQDAAANEAVLRDSMERFVRHPLVSPIFTDDMAGLPPILIQAGECEVLRDESVALAFKYLSQNKGSSTSWVRHEMYTDMVHVFQAMQWLPAAKLALKHMSQFFEEIDADASVPLETYRLTAEETRYVHMIDSHINM
ncbi:hypothetical protein BC831DRAFT_472959 [Entophlyctis helioformis]|nr:hypothetical protein BC831DRAFT_472959 [Entophlyctis helioformis]